MSTKPSNALRLEVPSDFGFTEEHALLRQETRRFLNERLPMGELRKLADAGVAFDRGLWKEIAELGWVGLVLPESMGGAGLGWLHLAILLEEMGRRLVPGPFLGSLLVAFFTATPSAWLLVFGPYLLFMAVRLLTRPLRRRA